MRGFRASRAVHNGFSARFGRQDQMPVRQPTQFGGHGAVKPELPAWLKVHTNPAPTPSAVEAPPAPRATLKLVKPPVKKTSAKRVVKSTAKKPAARKRVTRSSRVVKKSA